MARSPWTGPVYTTLGAPQPGRQRSAWTTPVYTTLVDPDPPDPDWAPLLDTDFSGMPTGQPPVGFTPRYATSAVTWVVEADGNFTGSRRLRGATGAGTFDRLLAIDALNGVVHPRIEVRAQAGVLLDNPWSWKLRATGTSGAGSQAGSQIEYSVTAVNFGDVDEHGPRLEMRFHKNILGVHNHLVTATDRFVTFEGDDTPTITPNCLFNQLAQGDWFRLYMWMVGPTVNYKFWREGDPEPTEPNTPGWVQHTDTQASAITSGQWSGPVVRRGSTNPNLLVDWIRAYEFVGELPEPPELSAPTGFGATSHTLNSIDVGWVDTNGGVRPYRLTWQLASASPSSDPFFPSAGTFETAIGATAGRYDGLPSGTAIRLRIVAFDPADPDVTSDPVDIIESTITDPNVIYLNDFTGELLGQQPAQTTKRWDPNSTYHVEEDAEFPGGRRLRVQRTDGLNAESAISFDAVGPRLNIGMLSPVRITDAVGLAAKLILRGAGGPASEATGYMLRFMVGSQEVRLSRFLNGSELPLDTAPLAIEEGDIFYGRIEAQVAQVRARVWREGQTEADAVALSGTDPSPLPAGWVGIGRRTGTGNPRSDFDWVQVYELVTLRALDPLMVLNADTTSWAYWPDELPFPEGLTRHFVPGPDPDPVPPEDMFINTSLPMPGHPQFDNPSLMDDAVTLNIGTPSEAPPSGFTLTGYWIRGIGSGEHSQVVGPDETDVILRQNNGLGSPYTLGQLNGEWFCLRAIYNGDTLSGNEDASQSANCGAYHASPPTGPPATAPQFTVEAFPGSHRVTITQFPAGADGVEIRRSLTPQSGTPSSPTAGELRAVRTPGQEVYTEESPALTRKDFFVVGFIDTED